MGGPLPGPGEGQMLCSRLSNADRKGEMSRRTLEIRRAAPPPSIFLYFFFVTCVFFLRHPTTQRLRHTPLLSPYVGPEYHHPSTSPPFFRLYNLFSSRPAYHYPGPGGCLAKKKINNGFGLSSSRGCGGIRYLRRGSWFSRRGGDAKKYQLKLQKELFFFWNALFLRSGGGEGAGKGGDGHILIIFFSYHCIFFLASYDAIPILLPAL